MLKREEDSDPIPVKIFYFYSDKEYEREEEAKQRLDLQLALLQNNVNVHLTDKHVIAGHVKDEIIERHLNEADIIILLIGHLTQTNAIKITTVMDYLMWSQSFHTIRPR